MTASSEDSLKAKLDGFGIGKTPSGMKVKHLSPLGLACGHFGRVSETD